MYSIDTALANASRWLHEAAEKCHNAAIELQHCATPSDDLHELATAISVL
jgi:hypothetical protein